MCENDYFLEEFKESYEHYRHLEKLRSGHITFFFTLVAGFFGFLGFLLKNGSPVSDWTMFVGGLTIVFLQILDTIIYASIRRIGDARAQHAKTLQYLREKLSNDHTIVNGWKAFEGNAQISVQIGAEITLHLFAILFFLAVATGVFFALNRCNLLCWQGCTVLSLSLTIFLAHIGIWLWLRYHK